MTLSRMVLVGLTGLLVGACGAETKDDPAAGNLPESARVREQVRAATRSSVADFPKVRGRSLQEVANSLDGAGGQVALANSVFTPGTNRVGFGFVDDKRQFIYGKTALYVADGPNAKARGPFPAPADSLITDPPFRSRTEASETDPFAALYETEVPLRGPGRQAVLAITKLDDGRVVGAANALRVVKPADDQVVRVGDRPPAVVTDTVAAAGGNIKAIDTRVPNDDMHEVSFDKVVGRKPVALLFATPQLCESQVCGPVVDIAQQLKQTYGDRIEFIHQEVYVGNDPSKGLRKPLVEFGLQTEPWLFVVDGSGRVTARLEGSFGFRAFERALKTGL